MNYYHVVSRKFCCCLPVRIGVFVLSALSAVVGAANAYVYWYVVVQTAKHGTVNDNMSTLDNINATQFQNATTFNDINMDLNGVALDKGQYYAFIVIGVIFTLYTLFSLFGFVGAIFRKRGLVAWYSTLLWVLLLLNLGVGIYSIDATIKQRQSLSDQCAAKTANSQSGTIANDENKVTSTICSAASKAGVALAIAIFVIEWLLQLYACIIVKRYVEQLSEEQAYRPHDAGNRIQKGGEAGSYYAHEPLVGGQHELGPYPYADAGHSFGNKP